MNRRRRAGSRPARGLARRATRDLRRWLGTRRPTGTEGRRAARRGSSRRSRAAARRAREQLRRSVDRWAVRTSARLGRGPGVSLIGLDVNRPPTRLRTRSWLPLVAAGLAGALFLAGLRMDVIRMRFALAQDFEQELRLEQLKRDLTVEMRRLRDPSVLERRARELGFRRAERMIDLPPRDGVGKPALDDRRSWLAAQREPVAPGERP